MFLEAAVCVVFVYLILKCFRKDEVQRSRFQDRVVVITGASSGLGKEFVRQFYRNGSKVIMAARRLDEMEKIKTELLSEKNPKLDGIRHEPKLVRLDLAQEDANVLEQAANTIFNIHGNIDIVINNAGLSSREGALQTDIHVDRTMMFVNYLNQILTTKIWLNSMIQKRSENGSTDRGHILSVSSVQGRIALPFRSSYSASKHALQAFYDSLRAELQSQNIPIDVTVISPGYIKTNLSLNAMTGSGQAYGQMDKTTASGAEPEAVVREAFIAIQNRKAEVVNCPFSARFMICLRPLIPRLYFRVMKFYARKQNKTNTN